MELGEDPFWFACAPDHPLANVQRLDPALLGEFELLLLEDGHCLRDHAIDACHLSGHGTRAAYSATSLFTLTQMVRSGLGATLLPEMAVKQGLAKSAELVAAPFIEPSPSRKIGLAWRKGSGRREEVEALSAVFGKLV